MADQETSDWSFTDTELYCMSMEKFNLIEKLGKGSIGTVQLAEYIPNGRLYALKIIKYKHAKTVMDGLNIAKNLLHENLVRCYGHFTQKYNGENCIISIMEFIQGEDLHTTYTTCNHKYIMKIFPVILPQIIAGIDYIHKKGSVHRDIKLENIMITSELKVKILDYDFLIRIDMINDSNICGTPYYVSPEILDDNNNVDHRTDLWSLGVALHILLTGTYPFDGDDKKELYDNITLTEPYFFKIPVNYREIIMGLLEKDVQHRLTLTQISTILKTR